MTGFVDRCHHLVSQKKCQSQQHGTKPRLSLVPTIVMRTQLYRFSCTLREEKLEVQSRHVKAESQQTKSGLDERFPLLLYHPPRVI
jgi:hypothetical protein